MRNTIIKMKSRLNRYSPNVLVLVFGLLFKSHTVYADMSTAHLEPENTNNIATVIPVAHSLLLELLDETDITVHYLPPKRLPINRLKNWVATHASKNHPEVSAVVGIDAMRPALSFYTALRKENIKTVNIDIAKALMPGGEQVAIYQKNQQGYFWLNINNALVMTGILRRDLTALWPHKAEAINRNAAKISQQLRQFSMQLDDEIFDREIEQLVVDKKHLADFAASFALPIVTLEQAKENGLKTLLVSKSKKAALPKNIALWTIDDFSKTAATSFTDRWLNTATNIK